MTISRAVAGPAPATPAAAAVGHHGRRHRWALLVYAVAVGVAVALFGVNGTLGVIAGALNVIFVAFFLRQLAFAVSAARWAQGNLDAATVGGGGFLPSVAVLVACRDDEPVPDDMITALLGLDYPADALTLVVVDDATTDGTAERLAARAAVEPRLRVLHRLAGAGGGRSDALNCALVGIRAELTVIVDPGHEPERTALRRLVRHFRDPRVGAVLGRRVVRNASLASTIFVDYLSGHLVNQYGRQALFELPASGGAPVAVRTSVLRALSGWNPDTGTGD
ncbi:MAG TPA: glycosyltransferase family 2 protein, partial [Catenuloplanes sp.]